MERAARRTGQSQLPNRPIPAGGTRERPIRLTNGVNVPDGSVETSRATPSRSICPISRPLVHGNAVGPALVGIDRNPGADALVLPWRAAQ